MNRARLLQAARVATGAVTIVAATLSLVHAAGRGVDLPFFRSHSLPKALVGTAVALALYALAGGRPLRGVSWFWRRLLAIWRMLSFLGRIDTHWWAVALALATMGFGLAYGSTAGSSADAHGYVSQADLWREGRVVVNQPFVEDLPFHNRQWMATTLGYRPSDRVDEPFALVPSYSPGLPILMAAAKTIGGQEAMFWIVPLSAAMLVLATYGIGRRLASPAVGLAGAWLIATSPVLLFMSVFPMSDVPVSAAWALTFYALLKPTGASAWSSGTAAAVAILIRPNTAVGAPILAMSFLLQAWSSRGEAWWPPVRRGLVFCLGVLPGVLTIALVNLRQNGSPLTSGYGSLDTWFDASHLLPNLRLYAGWLTAAQSPVVWLGVLAIAVPLRRWWPVAARSSLLVAAAFSAAIWLMYCDFLVFDAWWFLRFMLPVFPYVLLGVGAVAMWIARSHRVTAAVTVVGLIVLGGLGLRFTLAEHVTNLWRMERRFPSVARLTRGLTEPRSVVFAMQHSGTLRYYGGRLTFRFDSLGDDSMDAVVSFLQARRIHPYLLLEDSERPQFEALHVTQRVVGRLSEIPLLIYTGPATIRLFDLADRRVVEAPVEFRETYEGLRSLAPAPMPRFAMQRWTEERP